MTIQHVAIIGAGMPGLATAWYLQQHGVQVTVLERRHVAAGSSWGNAGWLTPALTVPLPEPAVLKYGVRAVVSPSSPVYVPLRPEARLLRFVGGFLRHSTQRRWAAGTRAYAPVNRIALHAFDELTSAGIGETRAADPFLACFRTEEDRAVLVAELDAIAESGQEVKYTELSGEEVRAAEPALSSEIGAAVRLHDQRFLNPPAFMESLATAVRARGGQIIEGVAVRDVRDVGDEVRVDLDAGASRGFDAVVLANGAWLGGLARRFGVRRVVQAGRGYSFSVPADPLPGGPVYFPRERIACTPLETPDGPRLRVAGMMEFRPADAPLDTRRVRAIVDAARPLLSGVDLDDRQDEWVGSRPCTTDGLPLIGATASSRVFTAGGHGMWGIALGPVTGRLLAERIVSGTTPPELVPFDPLR
jgi:D-amino-acid dehydrogenase